MLRLLKREYMTAISLNVHIVLSKNDVVCVCEIMLNSEHVHCDVLHYLAQCRAQCTS